MPRLRSFGSLGRKVKEGTAGQDKDQSSKSIGSWKIKKPKFVSTSKRDHSFSLQETPFPSELREIAAAAAVASSRDKTSPYAKGGDIGSSSAPQLPPLSTTSTSLSLFHSVPLQPLRAEGDHSQTSRLRAGNNEDSKLILMPPQPAFLGGRSSSVANASYNSLTATDYSKSDSLSTSRSSSRGTESPFTSYSSVNHTDESRRSKIERAEEQRDVEAGNLFSVRALGRRLFGKPSPSEETSSFHILEHKRPSLARKGSLIGGHDFRRSYFKELPATPLSSQPDTPSASSCTTEGSSSPELQSSAHLFPAIATRVDEMISRRRDSMSCNEVVQPSSPDVTITNSLQDNQESSDFLQAVLNYASPELELSTLTDLPPLKKQRSRIIMRQANGLNISVVEQEKKSKPKDCIMARSPWASNKKDAEAEEDSDDDYGEENDTIYCSESRPAMKPLKLRKAHLSSKKPNGIDTAAKKALYSCTITKFYPTLASTLNNGKKSSREIRLPRSINLAETLQGHASTYSHTRSIRIGLARTRIIRRLNTDHIPLIMEQELEWFVMKYLPHYIAPDQLPSRLAQKSAENRSLEALARPPLAQDGGNGMATWAKRRPFEQRCVSIGSEIDILSSRGIAAQFGLMMDKSKQLPRPMPLQLSKRCKALATNSIRAKSPNRGPTSSSPFNSSVVPTRSPPRRDLHRLAPPWLPQPARSSTDPSLLVSQSPSPLRSAPAILSSSSFVEAEAFSKMDVKAENEDENEEDMPLAKLMHRHSRALSERSMSGLASSVDEYTQRAQQQREREAFVRKQRGMKLVEDQKRLLGQARERRATTDHAAILSSPTYGAGNSLLLPKRMSRTGSENGLSTSPNAYSRKSQHVSQDDNYSTIKDRQQEGRRMTRYSNPSLPKSHSSTSVNVIPSETPTRSRRMSSQTGSAMPMFWSTSKNTSPPSSFQRRQSSTYITPNRMPLQTMPPPGMIPQAMIAPYGMIPITSPPILTRNGIVISPSFYNSPSICYNPTPPMSPLVCLSPSQVPLSARHSRIEAEV